MISISTGVDLVEIDRFRFIDQKILKRFLLRVFTTAELTDASKNENHLAGKFAAKEAAAKALGCGIGKVNWLDLEILNDPQGRPILVLHENALSAAHEAGWTQWSISISHTKANAVAVVTALVELPSPRQNVI
jgi:holo-[acyl-carrier protein] synthase